MKNHIKSLLAATLLVGSVAHADTVSNKTFMQPSTVGCDLARLDSIWHIQIHKPKNTEDNCRCPFGGYFQATGFYDQSTNKTGVGRYFGLNGSNVMTIGVGGTGVDIDNRNLIFNSTGADTLAGTITFHGKQRAAGVELSYFQNLDSITKGLNFLVVLPIASVKNTFNMTVTNETTQTVNGATVGIADYFNGTFSQPAGVSQQAALTNALIGHNDSHTAVADLEVRLGYDFYRTCHHHVGFNIAFVAPTGNEAHGKRVFEAMSGNGGYFGFGGGITASVMPWISDCQSIELFMDFKYRYLFKDSNTRTLGIRGLNWAQYQNIGTVGALGVTPGANILTRRVDVTPGSQVNAAFIFAYNLHGFTFDVGYELFAKESERVRLKTWEEGLYALAGNNYNTSVAFSLATDVALPSQTIAATSVSGAGTAITKDQVDTSPAATPSSVTNKAFGAIGYTWKGWTYPFMLKLGGGYSFAETRRNLSMWEIFGGFGFSF